MSQEARSNVAASVRQRLLNLSRQNGEEFGLLLSRFAVERLLYRLSISPHREEFVLKGAALFAVWENVPRRPTRDVDFLGSGDASPERLATVFRALCEIPVPEDGMYFGSSTVQVASIRDEQRYGGQRVRLEASLAQARIPLRIDIGFGDVVTPSPREAKYPTLLSLPAPTLRLYPPETVIAEKFQAMVELGAANSRLKDFRDVWILARHFAFDGALLSQALNATFARRGTSLPDAMPESLGDEFCRSGARITQWRAFTRKSRLQTVPELAEVAGALRAFLGPPVEALRADLPFSRKWSLDQGWQEK